MKWIEGVLTPYLEYETNPSAVQKSYVDGPRVQGI
jgi:hypothetical protein